MIKLDGCSVFNHTQYSTRNEEWIRSTQDERCKMSVPFFVSFCTYSYGQLVKDASNQIKISIVDDFLASKNVYQGSVV